MENEKESFVFYKSFYDALQDLKDKDRLKVYDAICEMALNGNERNLTGISKTVFTLIKPQVLANNRRYENGKKGGRPKKETIGFEKNKTIGYLKTETKTKPNVNVNVNVNDNDNVNENDEVSDSCVDGLQEVINFYENNIGLLSPYELEILTDYSKTFTNDMLIFAIKKAVEAKIRTMQYIKGILNNWNKKDIKNIIDAQKEDENFKNNKSNENKTLTKQKFNNYDQRIPENLDNFYAN